jgi:hypothetical protein
VLLRVQEQCHQILKHKVNQKMSLIPDVVKACMHLHNFMMDHGYIGAEEVVEFELEEEFGAGGRHEGLGDDAEVMTGSLAAYVHTL